VSPLGRGPPNGIGEEESEGVRDVARLVELELQDDLADGIPVEAGADCMQTGQRVAREGSVEAGEPAVVRRAQGERRETGTTEAAGDARVGQRTTCRAARWEGSVGDVRGEGCECGCECREERRKA
jgi:hypothetical protein